MVDSAALEMPYTRKGIVGSNPTSSAYTFRYELSLLRGERACLVPVRKFCPALRK